jgi:hypothetical protein
MVRAVAIDPLGGEQIDRIVGGFRETLVIVFFEVVFARKTDVGGIHVRWEVR